MENETFEINLKIISEWESQQEKYRLVNLGAGPDLIQEKIENEWVEVKIYYKWGIATNRIKSLEAKLSKLKKG